MQSIFTALKILCVSSILPSVPRYLSSHWAFLWLLKFYFSRILHSWTRMYSFQIGFFHFCIEVSFQIIWSLSGSSVTGLYTKGMFRFVRNCQTFLRNGCPIFHSHQQWMRVPVAPLLMFYVSAYKQPLSKTFRREPVLIIGIHMFLCSKIIHTI